MTEFRRVGQFGIEIGNTPAPIAREQLARFGKTGDYIDLMTTWGPGRAVGHVAFPDPTEPDGELALLQERYRLHAPHMRAVGKWTGLSNADVERALVIGYHRSGSVLVSGPSGLQFLAADGTDQHLYNLEASFGGELRGAKHAVATYMTGRAPRAELYAALARGDEAAADAVLAQINAHEFAWAMLEIAHDLALDLDLGPIANDLRASYFNHCLRLAKRTEDELGRFPVRPIADAIAKRALTPEQVAQVRTLAYPQTPFAGPRDARERELVAQHFATPSEKSILIVLADHLEERGQTVRAQLVREQSEAMSYDEARAKGLIVKHDVDSTKLLAEWQAAWAVDADAPLAPLVAAIDELDAQHRHAMIAWITVRELDKLAAEPAATPLLVLALRSRYAQVAIDMFVAGKRADMAPWLLRAIRTASESRMDYGSTTYWHEELATAFCALGKLKPAEITEVIGWLTTTTGPRRVAAAMLLQGHGKDDRVFEAALAHFADLSPYSEKIVGKRKTDPRVIPALRAAFAIAEKRSIPDGKHVRYTEDYRILSRYLAKLGDAEGKAAWERCKKMARVDRAAADREARRDGM